ncbi:hypothetical protein [Phytoactinopolyspora mesophila]|uniref:Uncharacterized protein n=1 Tax=Phytoactinopolyspora mesophila TaxID=2650750 RepID=A0A7K3M5M5_9ACTN|nr:hypothetical protein [Phytoactinopolyspora mesophila]NDL58613.1 hypothetical protein [Phytoactinopolyspora mesophila]
MRYAIHDGYRVEPTPGAKGVCPSCEGSVRAFCGQHREWHWRHKPAQPNCPLSVAGAECLDARDLPPDWVQLDVDGWPAFLGRGEFGSQARRYAGWAVIPEAALGDRELCEWQHCIVTGQGTATYVVIFDQEAAQHLERLMEHANATLDRADPTIRRDPATGKLMTSF